MRPTEKQILTALKDSEKHWKHNVELKKRGKLNFNIHCMGNTCACCQLFEGPPRCVKGNYKCPLNDAFCCGGLWGDALYNHTLENITAVYLYIRKYRRAYEKKKKG